MDTQCVRDSCLCLTLILWGDHMKGSQCTHLFPVSQGDAHLHQSKKKKTLRELDAALSACFSVLATVEISASCSGGRYAGGWRVSSLTKNNESFTVLVSGWTWMNVPGFSLLTHSSTTPCRELSEAPFKSQQRGSCWCGRLDSWNLLVLSSGGGGGGGGCCWPRKSFYLCFGC